MIDCYKLISAYNTRVAELNSKPELVQAFEIKTLLDILTQYATVVPQNMDCTDWAVKLVVVIAELNAVFAYSQRQKRLTLVTLTEQQKETIELLTDLLR